MQNEVSTIAAGGGPVAALVMIFTGASCWLYSTVVKVFQAAPELMAQAAPSGSSLSWAEIGQWVSGACVVAGIIIGRVTATRSKFDEERRRREELDAESRRRREATDAEERRRRDVADGMARIEVMVAQKMAEIEIHQAEIRAHLGRQDEAFQQAASSASSAPAVNLTITTPAAPVPAPDQTAS